MEFGRLLLLVDDSPNALKAAELGYQVASDMKATVTLLYVIDEALAMGNVDAGIFPDEALAKLKAHAEKLLDHIRVEFSLGVETEILIPVGEEEKVILSIAKDSGAKMIIMGTHSRTGLDRLLMGSVTESVLRHSTIPVLVVPMK